MWSVIKKNPISTFAVICVALIGFFLAYMVVWQTSILTSPDWCKRALGAEKVAPGQTYQQAMEALQSCNEILKIQLNAVAVDSHIDHGGQNLVLIILMVVVVAGARMAFKVSREGIEGNIARNDAPTVTTTTTVAPTPTPTPTPIIPVAPIPQPVPEHKGPAMPEPK